MTPLKPLKKLLMHIPWVTKRPLARGLIASIIILVSLFVLFETLDTIREIRKIATGSVWHIPSKILSDITLIRPGTDIRLLGLRPRLERLRYRRVQKVSHPGEYAWYRDHIVIYPRRFKYPFMDTSSSTGMVMDIDIEANTVVNIYRHDTGRPIKEICLEPEVIAKILDTHHEDRSIVSLTECPTYLLDAILCTEDKRFYKHSGIDLFAIIRATLVDIRHGSFVEGASTITQQLIKNMFLSSRRSITRKIKETFMAMVMDATYTKDEILGMYINEVYMGQYGYAGIYGIGRAAELYFDKPVSSLSLSEAALLAGIIRAPNKYSPYKYPSRALARRNTVLKIMYTESKITRDTYSQAIKSPLGVVPLKEWKRQAPYFVDYLLALLKDTLSRDELAKGGYNIYTTIDTHMQSIATTTLQHSIKNICRRSNVPVQGAVVICDSHTGDIKAMVGGYDYGISQYNRAIKLKRQIGSLIKPVVYYTALRQGYTLSSFVDDEPISLTLDDKTQWKPRNFDNKSHGMVMLIDALAKSYNMATVRLGIKVGIGNVARNLQLMLPDHTFSTNPSLLLGSIGLSPLEVSTLYCAFANGGFRVRPRAIRFITNENGTIILDNRHVNTVQVLDPSVVYILDHALIRVITEGTASKASMYGMPHGICGKTGTTDELRDSWFVCFSPREVVTVWLGNDSFKPIGLTGAEGAMPVAAMIMSSIEKRALWNRPRDVVLCKVDRRNGKPAGLFNSYSVTLPYIQGTGPTAMHPGQGSPIVRFIHSLFGRD